MEYELRFIDLMRDGREREGWYNCDGFDGQLVSESLWYALFQEIKETFDILLIVLI